jgi:undecaprenyl-phosphate galactose phosphotransferase/putative colanic acid biosynthesis UDP-glucose lipid carrier transferase
LIGDFFIIIVSGILANAGYHWLFLSAGDHIFDSIPLAILVFANFVALMSAQQNYRLINLINSRRQLRYVAINWVFIFFILVAVAFTLKISTEFSRGFALSFLVVGYLGLIAYRLSLARYLKQALQEGAFARQKVMLISERGQQPISRALAELQQCGYEPIRTFELTPFEISADGQTSLKGKMREIISAAQSEQVDYIFLLLKWSQPQLINSIMNILHRLPTPVHLLPDENVASFLFARTVNIGQTLTVELQRAPLTKLEQAVKRGFDLSIATVMLILLSPLMLITAFLVTVDSPGPILFKQKRNGFNGELFTIYKFRTMCVIEDGDRVAQAKRGDARVTRLGRWLRSTSIDELPQLLNVLSGEMSLVGPRPHAVAHNNEYQKILFKYAFRHHVKPGITGWAQVNGLRGETETVQLMARRIEHDLWYINNWSIWLDLRILFKTVVQAHRHYARAY